MSDFLLFAAVLCIFAFVCFSLRFLAISGLLFDCFSGVLGCFFGFLVVLVVRAFLGLFWGFFWLFFSGFWGLFFGVFRFGFVFVFGVVFRPAHPAETLMCKGWGKEWKGASERTENRAQRQAQSGKERKKGRQPDC